MLIGILIGRQEGILELVLPNSSLISLNPGGQLHVLMGSLTHSCLNGQFMTYWATRRGTPARRASEKG